MMKLRYGLVELPEQGADAAQTHHNDETGGEMTKPGICRDVVYRAKILDHDGHLKESCDRPAKVSFVYEDGTSVDLTWCGRGAAEYASHNEERIPYDATGKEMGTWRWPPGSPAALETAAADEAKK